jgi:hypothetical protein
VGQAYGGEGLWLKKGQERIFPGLLMHPETPVLGAFNMFVEKLSAWESQQSS